jgi:hypothetical protein
MADQFNGLKFRVQEDIFDSKSMLDETNFYNQRQGSPSVLSKKLTYILGKESQEYPISLMTEGGIGYDGGAMKRTAVELDDVQFTYPVMGRNGKVAVCIGSPYVDGDKPGVGNMPFFIYLNDNWIKRFKTIVSTHGVSAYVLEDPEPLVGGGFKYKIQLNPAGPADYCPTSELVNGTLWVDTMVNVAESESRGTETGMVMPGMFKNQMGFLRLSSSWAGNAANKTMKIDITNSQGKTTNVWMDYFMWQFEKEWLSIKEHSYWYSRYNRLTNGEIPLKDLFTGKVIPTGSGLLEQIPNKSTYSDLTYDFLANKVGDALFGQADAAGLSITLHTGTGGRRAFHRAMIAAGAEFVGAYGAGNVADKFVTGTGRNLMLGGFFDGFYHIDGYVIKLKYNPIFDRGKIAQVSPKHPESGLPLESYRMVFIDDNDYDGQPNIQHVAQKGRAYLDGVVQGLTPAPRSVELLSGITGGAASKLLSTEQDKSSYHRFSSCGIQMLRANRCFDLQCVAGQ